MLVFAVQKSRVQVWLYGRGKMRIEGTIIVSHVTHPLHFLHAHTHAGLWWVYESCHGQCWRSVCQEWSISKARGCVPLVVCVCVCVCVWQCVPPCRSYIAERGQYNAPHVLWWGTKVATTNILSFFWFLYFCCSCDLLVCLYNSL